MQRVKAGMPAVTARAAEETKAAAGAVRTLRPWPRQVRTPLHRPPAARTHVGAERKYARACLARRRNRRRQPLLGRRAAAGGGPAWQGEPACGAAASTGRRRPQLISQLGQAPACGRLALLCQVGGANRWHRRRSSAVAAVQSTPSEAASARRARLLPAPCSRCQRRPHPLTQAPPRRRTPPRPRPAPRSAPSACVREACRRSRRTGH